MFIWVNCLFAALDSGKLGCCFSKGALSALEKIDTILGVVNNASIEMNEDIQELIKERNKARSEKDWEKADKIRKELDEMDIILDDTSEGTVWKRK